MRAYFRSVRRMLNRVSFPKAQYFLGLILDAMIFPLEQICVGMMQKFPVNAVEYQDMSYLTGIYTLAIAILVMVFVVNPLADCLKEQTMQIYIKGLRELTLDRLLTCDCSFFESYQTGELMTRLRDNLNGIPSIYTESIFRLLLGIFYGGGSIAIMLAFSWQLSLAVIVLCVTEAYVVAVISKRIEKRTEMLQQILDGQNQILFDIIRNLQMIRVFSIASWAKNRFQKAGEQAAEKSLEINSVNVQLNLLEEVFEAFNLVLIFNFGVLLYLWEKIDLGSVMVFLFLQDGISYMLGNLREFFAGMSPQIVSCNRVEEILIRTDAGAFGKQEPGTEEKWLEEQAPEKAEIRIQNLSFRYHPGSAEVLRNLNLSIPRGKITVIYGSSGSGKTTLLRLLLALYQPESGSIRIGERDYREMDGDTIRRYYACVEQFPYLFHDTIEANIRGNCVEASAEEVVKAAKQANAHDFIMQKKEGYQTMVLEHGGNFSSGERQRLAIARAILRDSPVVILDEATSGVDLEGESDIHAQLRLIASQGKTILIVAHREHARWIADHEIRLV